MNKDLPNFHKINDNFYRGGQPTEEGIRQLAKLGIKTVINFRDPNRKVSREKQISEENGMKFFNPHLSNWFKAKDSDIEKILEVIQNPENQPVFIHCKRGADRTGTVVAVYRIIYENWTAKEANEEAKKLGLGWWQVWMKDYIKNYYKRFKKMNYEIILYNIQETRQQLENIEKELKNKDLSEIEFQSKLEYAFHHLNFAWNIRYVSTEKYQNLSQEDFEKWHKYPKEFKK